MNLNLKTCYFINGISFENPEAYNHVVSILREVKASNKIKPTKQLMKMLYNLLIENHNNQTLISLLQYCFATSATNILFRLNSMKWQFHDYIKPSNKAKQDYQKLMDLFKKNKAFYK